MKSLLIVALLFVAAQADVLHVSRTFPEIEGAPQYPTPKIINGIQATRGLLPYQAALYLNGNSFCGGSLISTRWVLTAAHCASGINSFTVHLGAQAISQTSETGRVIITTTSKVVHASYSGSTLANDIALVNLGQNVALSSYIQTVGLASGSATYAGNTARVSGWGRVSDASSSISPQLMYVDVSVITNAVCTQSYGTIIRASTICTLGSGGRATCNGDSGGPLLDRFSNVQIGVVSFGSSAGCQSGAPNGFARVTEFRDWIRTNSGV